MNPMIAALQKNRGEVVKPSADSGAEDAAQDKGMGGDLQKYWAMMQDMNSKMDQIMSALGIGGNAPEKKEMNDGNGKPGY